MLLKCICFFPFYMQPNVSTEAKKISIYLNMVGKKINWIVIYLKLRIIIVCKMLLRSNRIRIRPGERVQECRVESHGLIVILRTCEWEELNCTPVSVRFTLNYSL